VKRERPCAAVNSKAEDAEIEDVELGAVGWAVQTREALAACLVTDTTVPAVVLRDEGPRGTP
jgi:hypothetical protein